MWTFRSALFLVLAVAVLVDCYPSERATESVEDDQEDVSVPSIPAVIVPSGPGFGYLPDFYGFFPDFDLVARIRALVSRLRTQIGNSFSDFDWNRGNATSTTKVVDGHVVTVNETSIQDDDSDLVLHVRVIDVRPTEGADDSSEDSSQIPETTTPKTGITTSKAEITTPKTTDNAGDRSPSPTNSEEHLGNEIPEQPEEGVAESLDYNYEETRDHHIITHSEHISPGHSIDEVDPVNDEVDNSIGMIQHEQHMSAK